MISAHPGGDKGIVSVLGGKRDAELIGEVGFDAIEHIDAKAKQKISSPGVLSQETLDNLARLEFSDPKRLTEHRHQGFGRGAGSGNVAEVERHRGAGKSAVLETLRYALDIEPYPEPTYRAELVRHALASGGQVTVRLARPESPEGRYVVRRVLTPGPASGPQGIADCEDATGEQAGR